MSRVWFAAFLIPAIAIAGWFSQAQHSLEQVPFLERLAGQIERAWVIPSKTTGAVEASVASRQCRGFSMEEQRQLFRDAVISRIDAGPEATRTVRACVMDIQGADDVRDKAVTTKHE